MSGLPNRNQFVDDLNDFARDRPGDRRLAVLIDLADPKQISHVQRVLGPGSLDDLVRSATRAIQDVVGPATKAYTLGVTHTVFIGDDTDAENGTDIADRLHARLRTAILCNGIPIPIHPAIGLSPFVLGESAPADILRTAMSAAQDAREAERQSGVYSQSRDAVHRRSFAVLTQVPEALGAADQLRLVFQPRVDLRSGACQGAEALLRWHHPQLGHVSPGEFIPLVEQTALARPVTEWVIDAALRQADAWRRSGLDLKLSINVSAANLEEEDFGPRLTRALESYDVPPAAIELEFTESALIRNGTRVLGHLQDICASGVTIAIDDFGTGYSSLSYLQKLPATVLKIDQSFVRSLASEARDRTLVKSIVSMAHDLGYRVVAEGVETAESYDFLVQAGCDEAQGYLISRPVPASAIEPWLAEWTGSTRTAAA